MENGYKEKRKCYICGYESEQILTLSSSEIEDNVNNSSCTLKRPLLN